MASRSVPDASRRRREKRRQLDARRSKCRIRLGGHMERWCLLKERLGFALHSQLAKFLLDRSEPEVPRPPCSVTCTSKKEQTPAAPEALPTPLAVSSSPAPSEVQLELSRTPLEGGQAEPLASPRSQAESAPAPAWDEDTAQIGPKRIRKAAKRELMPCDFPGCGRIFSNRQYLNHHKKYQHLHQKSFCCPEPACGKSFNFKKHLKEHVKLHSDTRDYICEFCARSFRTSSNLVIHRRIHTGEKPLQCEICGFTCRQKASLNWHRRKHAETVAALRFPCDFCGKRFEKPDSVVAHCSKSHPALLPAAHESPSPSESCPSVAAPKSLGSTEGFRSPLSLGSNPAPSAVGVISSSELGEPSSAPVIERFEDIVQIT